MRNPNRSPILAVPAFIALSLGAYACGKQESICQTQASLTGAPHTVKLSVRVQEDQLPKGYTRTTEFKYDDGTSGPSATHTYAQPGKVEPWAVLHFAPVPGALPADGNLEAISCSATEITIPK